MGVLCEIFDCSITTGQGLMERGRMKTIGFLVSCYLILVDGQPLSQASYGPEPDDQAHDWVGLLYEVPVFILYICSVRDTDSSQLIHSSSDPVFRYQDFRHNNALANSLEAVRSFRHPQVAGLDNTGRKDDDRQQLQYEKLPKYRDQTERNGFRNTLNVEELFEEDSEFTQPMSSFVIPAVYGPHRS